MPEAERIAVIIPCFNDGALVAEAVASVQEDEPVEIVVVDDCSEDPGTLDQLDTLEREGVRVLRHERNRGVAAARTTGLEATRARYVFPLDSDDLAVRGALGAMADRLDADAGAAVCYGDYAEFGERNLIRAVPLTIDPYRIAFTNEYPISALLRRATLETVGGWTGTAYTGRSYEDWNLWMTLAERGERGIHLGMGQLCYRRRLHGERKLATGKRRHRALYRELRRAHPKLFGELDEHRKRTTLSAVRRALYPFVYGGRRRFGFESRVKDVLDRTGIWTLRRGDASPAPALPPSRSSRDGSPRIAVIIPCYGDGVLLRQAVSSVQEQEPVELVVVDDFSEDESTRSVLLELEREGIRVLRHERNQGLAAARRTGLQATSAEFVFPLDSDDLAVPGMLGLLADRLEAQPDAAVCFGDYAEFGRHELIRAVPQRIDPYRLAYTNEYPVSAMFRRRVLDAVGAWPSLTAYEDWHLWMTLAEQGAVGVHAGPGVVTYRRRLHGQRLLAAGRQSHRRLYEELRVDHPQLFSAVSRHRKRSALHPLRKALYPVIYGGRRRYSWEPDVKAALDRLGIWTLRR